MKMQWVLLVVAVLLLSANAAAQCIGSGSLVCMLPNLYGQHINTFTTPPQVEEGIALPRSDHAAHFATASLASLTPLDTAIGTQLSSLPTVSPTSGLLFTFAGGVVTRAATSFGPILGERAETVGRHHAFVSFNYQYFSFSSLDGFDLKHLPAVYSHFPIPNSTEPFLHDVIVADNRIDLRVNQFTMYGGFGLTDRIDVSLAVPINNVRMSVASNTTIVPSAGSICPITTTPPITTLCHFFGADANGQPITTKTFPSEASATGIGDVTVRVKGTVFKGEHAGAALGADVRLPTGDEKNFLGSGAYGFRPFVALSYAARVTPHVNVGYEWNGDSILAGQISSTGALSEARLPNQLFYSVGADAALSRRVSVAVDLLGQHVLGGVRIAPATDSVVQSGQTTPTTFATTVQRRESFTMNNLAVGAKFNPGRNLLLSANVLFKLDDPGLRAKAIPLVGVSYRF